MLKNVQIYFRLGKTLSRIVKSIHMVLYQLPKLRLVIIIIVYSPATIKTGCISHYQFTIITTQSTMCLVQNKIIMIPTVLPKLTTIIPINQITIPTTNTIRIPRAQTLPTTQVTLKTPILPLKPKKTTPAFTTVTSTKPALCT
jgi:hypothetical protein